MQKRLRWANIAWIANLQFFVVQLIVGFTFRPVYSLVDNTISDLGNTQCSIYGSREVCSTLHPLMNVSFVLLGLTMTIGAYFYWKYLDNDKLSRLGFLLIGLSGVGSIIVGIFPENTTGSAHLIGAGLSFIFGNIGLVLVSLSNKSQLNSLFRKTSIIMGTTALIATLLFATSNYLYLGLGGIERIAAYTQTIWMISFGIYKSKTSTSTVHRCQT